MTIMMTMVMMIIVGRLLGWTAGYFIGDGDWYDDDNNDNGDGEYDDDDYSWEAVGLVGWTGGYRLLHLQPPSNSQHKSLSATTGLREAPRSLSETFSQNNLELFLFGNRLMVLEAVSEEDRVARTTSLSFSS